MNERKNDALPVIAVAMGDPSGISPELTARILSEADLRGAARYVVFGDKRLLDLGIKDGGVDLSVMNWRMVAAGPGLSEEQVGAITADIEKMVNSATWKKTLETKGWINTFLAGEEFKAQLATEIAATEAILKDIGLVQ